MFGKNSARGSAKEDAKHPNMKKYINKRPKAMKPPELDERQLSERNQA